MQGEGRNVLVTGGASGLGEGIVSHYARTGAHVVIADRNEELGRALEHDLTAKGHSVKYIFVDVVSIASQARMLKEALNWFQADRGIDTLILSAGINGNPFDLVPESPSGLSDVGITSLLEKNAATLQVNLTSGLQLIQLAVKYAMGLESNPNGERVSVGVKSITLVASLASYRGLPRAVDYTAAKWGLRGAFRSLRQQLPKIGTRVNMVAPSFVSTPLLADTKPMYESIGVKFAKKEDVVAAVSRVVDDEQCNGRAYAVSSEGFVDINDDVAGRDGSDVIDGLVNRGALGTENCPIGHDGTA